VIPAVDFAHACRDAPFYFSFPIKFFSKIKNRTVSMMKTSLLHRGRSRRVLVRVVPDCCGLYRIEWPDCGLSDLANLTRCKAAAREWAERNAILEDRKNNAARRLKSLDNFWWSSSYIAQNDQVAAEHGVIVAEFVRERGDNGGEGMRVVVSASSSSRISKKAPSF
jgi:hypothetical protein